MQFEKFIPSAKGKALLKYEGSDLLFRSDEGHTRIIPVTLYPKVRRNEVFSFYEDVSLSLRTFHDSEILLPLKERYILWKGSADGKVVWIQDEGINANRFEFDYSVDEDYLILMGRFNLRVSRSLAEVRLEEYSYAAIFEIKKVNKYLLEKVNQLISPAN